MRDKEGPVCSVQHQTEPVASFVPPKTLPSQSTFFHLAFTPFSTPLPNSLPTSKRTRLTSDLHSSSSMSFRIKHQVFSFLLLPSSYILFLFPLSHIPYTMSYLKGQFCPPISTCECTGGLIFSHCRGETSDCVYRVCSFQNKKIVHMTC